MVIFDSSRGWYEVLDQKLEQEQLEYWVKALIEPPRRDPEDSAEYNWMS
jgi:hypothetical protein